MVCSTNMPVTSSSDGFLGCRPWISPFHSTESISDLSCNHLVPQQGVDTSWNTFVVSSQNLFPPATLSRRIKYHSLSRARLSHNTVLWNTSTHLCAKAQQCSCHFYEHHIWGLLSLQQICIQSFRAAEKYQSKLYFEGKSYFPLLGENQAISTAQPMHILVT